MGNLNWKQAFKGARETKRGFTLLELLVVLTALLVLSTIAMYLYQRSLAYAKDTVCQTNLRALHEAVTLYSSENHALPASLGELKLEHLEKGYAKAMRGKAWLTKASTLLIKLDASNHAYAQFLTYDNLKKYGATSEIFHCPGDHNGGASYGINGELQGKSWAEVSKGAIVVADCDSYVFHSLDQLSPRHDHKVFVSIKSGDVVELEDKKIAGIKEGTEKDKKIDIPGTKPPKGEPERYGDDDDDHDHGYGNDDLVKKDPDTSTATGLPTKSKGQPGRQGDDDDDDGDEADDDVDDVDDDNSVKKDPSTSIAAGLPANLKETVHRFDKLVTKNLDTPIADKAEDVRNKLITSINELSKSPPDIQAARGNIEGAKGDLQAMIDDGLIDSAKGLALMNLLSALSGQL